MFILFQISQKCARPKTKKVHVWINMVWITFLSYYILCKNGLGPNQKSACMKSVVWIAFPSYYGLCENRLGPKQKSACTTKVV